MRNVRERQSRAVPARRPMRTRLVPGERARVIVALLRSGITDEVELAEKSGSPRSYVIQVLDMPASAFPK